MNEVLKVIKSRRSVRSFLSEQIGQAELDMIVEAGMYAPSGHNTQPWYFTVIQNRDVINNINKVAKEVMTGVDNEWIKNAGRNPDYDITYKAPTLIVISGKKDAVTSRIDCAAATQNMLLAAESLKIGSVWLGFATFCFMRSGEAEKIDIPEGYEPYYAAAFGYKAQDSQSPAPTRNTDVVKYIK